MQVIPFARPRAPWEPDRIGIDGVVEGWLAGDHRPSFVLDHLTPARAERSSPLPDAIAPRVRAALKLRGIERLYSHQLEAFDAVRTRDIVVATPTASGKSLTYHLPVADALARDPEARALYLFPTKALSRDQEHGVRDLIRDAGLERGAVTYDGDTPQDARRAARERSSIVITNPDMLHSGILPQHASWARFFAGLRHVVIDELHAYRGVFGSHLANVVRRLLRIAAFHGASPRVIACSATIGNPEEHAARMFGRSVHPIEESGAPAGERRVLLYNPPVVNAELGIRASAVKSAVRLTADLVRGGVSTLLFGQSRNQVELMLKYLREALPDRSPEALAAYRGGYLANERRRIERGLKEGAIECVVATNALELGVDIGSLDAVVCAGYPGTMANLWQRFGRAGRTRGPSLGVLVLSSAPIDQYLARRPRLVVDAPVEHARIDPNNVEILIQHLECGGFELPFAAGEPFGDVEPAAVEGALDYLAEHRVLRPVPDRTGRRIYHFVADVFPASAVSLRSASFDNFVIVDVEKGETIAEMDFRSAHTMLHEQAIYQQDAEQYQVEVLDFENHKAFVRRVEPDYYTTAMTHTKVSILEEERSEPIALGRWSLSSGLGDVDVVEKVVGFKKIKFNTHENVGYGEVDLPAMEKPTTACWLSFPEALLDATSLPRPALMDALHGFASLMRAVAAVGLMMDPRDLGIAVVDEREIGAGPARAPRFEPTIYLYDSVAGGIGLAPRLFEDRRSLFTRAAEVVRSCGCERGCPSCIGPSMPKAELSGLLAELGV
jgi:DEAD/DEAH box helicase domain-containing protein